jgi:NAD(P)H-hydrate epimerase
MKSGAGAVVLGIPEAVFSVVARRTLEVMPFALPSTPEGSVASSAMSAIDQKMTWADVLLVGPGLSQNRETQDLVRRIVTTSTKTIVVDADGLNALAADSSILGRRKSRRIILTPHVGEFSRLLRITSKEIEKNKIEIARTFARDNNVVLVLKGAPTVIAEPKGRVFVNPTGNPGMATAGSGDVLSGIIAALVGQGNGTVDAAVNAVFVHGLAGDLARQELGELGMIASDIMKKVPSALKLAQKGRTLFGD